MYYRVAEALEASTTQCLLDGVITKEEFGLLLKKYLADFNIIKIDERETIRFKHKKNYIVFIAKK